MIPSRKSGIDPLALLTLALFWTDMSTNTGHSDDGDRIDDHLHEPPTKVCDGCATTDGPIQLVELSTPERLLRVCQDCRADLRANIEQVVTHDE
jgi:hypothetical protein